MEKKLIKIIFKIFKKGENSQNMNLYKYMQISFDST